jgi:hypothetical protein
VDPFDSLGQMLGGFNVQEAEAYADYVRETSGEEEAAKLPPYRSLPMQTLDHAVGFLLAFGIAALLCKTVTNDKCDSVVGEDRVVDQTVLAELRWQGWPGKLRENARTCGEGGKKRTMRLSHL